MNGFLIKLTVGVSPILGAATGQMIEEHTLNLPTLFAVAGIVIPATWWLSRKFNSIEMDLRELKEHVKKIVCTAEGAEVRLHDVEKQHKLK